MSLQLFPVFPVIWKPSRCIKSSDFSIKLIYYFLFVLPLASHDLCTQCLGVPDGENIHIIVNCFTVNKEKRLL